MTHVTVMGPERRRRWSVDERRQILGAAFSPGAVVADVSRQYEVSTSLIYKWRRDVLAAQAAASRSEGKFVPATIIDEPVARDPQGKLEPVICVELGRGRRVTIGAMASPSLVSATLRALR
jgi:transposase